VTGTFENLRHHILRSTCEGGTKLGNIFVGLDFNLFSGAKVGNFDDSFFGNKNVGAFEISVNDTFLVKVLYCLNDLLK
jgi:hypothetical protein